MDKIAFIVASMFFVIVALNMNYIFDYVYYIIHTSTKDRKEVKLIYYNIIKSLRLTPTNWKVKNSHYDMKVYLSNETESLSIIWYHKELAKSSISKDSKSLKISFFQQTRLQNKIKNYLKQNNITI